jgi:uncharacterized protein YutE (UPF0331/DUF86 family)
MTDADLVAKRLAFIETCVAQLRTMAKPALVATDVREERFVEHTLQLAIQAAIDVASHIVADERLGEPKTNHELFDLLARAGWLQEGQRRTMHEMTGFRNVVVHGYTDVDTSVVREILERHLDDLLAFVRAIRARIPQS